MGKYKLNPEIVRRLQSDKPSLVIPIINQLRQSMHASAYLPEVISLLNKTQNEETRREISGFLNDIKNPESIPHFLDALNNTDYRSVWNIITAACWQSGMNFSNNLDTFIRILLQEDYTTSLEAFSVIEQSLPSLEHQKVSHYREELEGGLPAVDTAKLALVREMIRSMQDY